MKAKKKNKIKGKSTGDVVDATLSKEVEAIQNNSSLARVPASDLLFSRIL